MSDYGLCHTFKYKQKTKINSFKSKFWKEDNNVALSALSNKQLKYLWRLQLFILPRVTDLDKLLCVAHCNGSCWSFAISSIWHMRPHPDILQFLFSLHSTLLWHVLKRPPLFSTLNLWNLPCPSRHINLDSTSDLSENSLKLLRTQLTVSRLPPLHQLHNIFWSLLALLCQLLKILCQLVVFSMK